MKNNNTNFIRNAVIADLDSGKYKNIVLRFPPEPNGYLHIGHAKAIFLNFNLAKEFAGRVHLRFDDTNPVKEDEHYINAIKADIRWLGLEWDHLYYASDYFEEMYERAVLLIKKGLAYVDDLSQEEIKTYRGTLTNKGTNSPWRERETSENLQLFANMRAGKYKNGEKVLRAKIDMSSPNINMRDPVIYRIAHTQHHHVGSNWCVYPTYSYAHPLEDAIEGVTHSLCSLEFEDQRPFYLWVNEKCEMKSQPMQYEFGRLKITNTVTSKRKLKQLVDDKIVTGWDDPRMPTLSGLRRRGYTPEAISMFIENLAVAKTQGTVELAMLEHFVREDLKLKAPRTMAVLKPLKVVIENYPENKSEIIYAENNPENPEMGTRELIFAREIYIERDDFLEKPPAKYFRLSPGIEVRLKHAYFIKCTKVVKDEQGEVVELRCTYDPETKSGTNFTARKVKGTIHWVEAKGAVPATFRLYEPLILESTGEENSDFRNDINQNSLTEVTGYVEPSLRNVTNEEKFQFFRHGYFITDLCASSSDKLIFNRTVSLKSSFKI